MDLRFRNTKVERMGQLYLYTDLGLLHLYAEQSEWLRHWIRANRTVNECIIEASTLGDTEGAIAVMYNRVVSMHEMMKQCLGIFDVKKELANRGVVIEQKNDFEGAEFLGPALKFM